MSLSRTVRRALDALQRFVSPDLPGTTPLTVQAAQALVNRHRISSLMSYRQFDETDRLVFMEEATGVSAGFVLLLNPMMHAGPSVEEDIETALRACPADTVVQFGVLSTPQVEGFINAWTNARLEKASHPVMKQIALRRREFMLAGAVGPSLLPHTRLHPRMTQHYVAVRVPFTGDLSSQNELQAFVQIVKDLRSTLSGALRSAGMDNSEADEASVKFLLRELLNPNIDPNTRALDANPNVSLAEDLTDPATRLKMRGDGFLSFSSQGEPDSEVVVVPITTDALPRMLTLPMMPQVLGNPMARDERISVPYWAYTNIQVLDAEKSKDALTAKLGFLNKQTTSTSGWYRSMMGFLYERKEMVDQLLGETRKGYRLVRAYSGVNLYCPPDDIRQTVEYVKGLYRRAGIRASEERFIALPAFVASLPLQYNPAMDQPQKGLQRAQMMHSLNAASFVHVQGDWRGTPPSMGGPLMVSRRGQLACFNLLKSSTNYNFVVVAESGSGKSFLTNEIASDFLSKGGLVRIIDVGYSYAKFCETLDGVNLVFDPEDPVSLNPFTGIDSTDKLHEMTPMLKDLLRQMAYPLQSESDTPAWQYQALEAAILNAWEKHRGDTDIRHVYEWLLNHSDERSRDLAFQLESYAIGRYSRWFSGPRQVNLDNNLVVVELERLKQDPQLQAAVLTLIISTVTKEMYLSGTSVPKLLAIDEAWDLLGNVKTGKFIETAFRRIRKYNGIAGVITQSFQDFDKSEAAKASIDNAAWTFILQQKASSIEHALATKRIEDWQVEMLRGVKSGPGFSEVYVSSDSGSGLYRFVSDRHTYYTFTTAPADKNRIKQLTDAGLSMAEAIDKLAMEDYVRQWGAAPSQILSGEVPEESLED